MSTYDWRSDMELHQESVRIIEKLTKERDEAREELKQSEAIRKAYRKPPADFQKETIEFLVEVAFRAGEISHMRACELLGEKMEDFRDRQWVQGNGVDSEGDD